MRQEISLSLLGEVFAKGFAAFKQNSLGMVSVLVIGLVLLLGFTYVPSIHEAFNQLAAWKTKLGLFYPILAMGLVAGLFPIVLNLVLNQQMPHFRVWVLALIYWPYRGVEIDLLYKGLGKHLGNGTDLATVLLKMSLDMGIYVPFFSLPLYVLIFAWQEHENPIELLKTKAFWLDRYLPGVLANWLLWIPAVAIIYSLPPGLQLPLQNLFMVIWLFIIAVIAKAKLVK